MNMRIGFLLVLTLGFGGRDAAAQNKPWPSGVRASRIERPAANVLKATGNVDATVAGWRIQADSLEVRGDPTDTTTSSHALEIVAVGNVVLQRGQERLELRRLEFDPRSGRGIFDLQRP